MRLCSLSLPLSLTRTRPVRARSGKGADGIKNLWKDYLGFRSIVIFVVFIILLSKRIIFHLRDFFLESDRHDIDL